MISQVILTGIHGIAVKAVSRSLSAEILDIRIITSEQWAVFEYDPDTHKVVRSKMSNLLCPKRAREVKQAQQCQLWVFPLM